MRVVVLAGTSLKSFRMWLLGRALLILVHDIQPHRLRRSYKDRLMAIHDSVHEDSVFRGKSVSPRPSYHDRLTGMRDLHGGRNALQRESIDYCMST